MYKSLEEICEMTTKEGKPFWKIVQEDDCREQGISEGEAFEQMRGRYEAMREAVGKLCVEPNVLLNDAVTIPMIPPHIVQVPIIKGDAKSVSIAAASIVAKVTRDRMMTEYEEVLPGYGFASNKGYG